MNKFSDFTKVDINKESNQNKEKVEDFLNKYSGFNKDELMQEFLKVSMEKKKNGGFSAGEIENIKSTLSPFLNSEQKKNLESLINMVK